MINIRKREEAVMDLFRDITILDQEGKEFKVPAVYGSNARLEAYMSYGKDNSIVSGVSKPDVMRLPIIGIILASVSQTTMNFNGMIYSLYRQDLNQIIEKMFRIEDDARQVTMGTFSIQEEDLSCGKTVVSSHFNIEVKS